MLAPLAGRIDRALARWVAWVDRRPGRVLVVAGLFTALLGAYAAGHLGVNPDPRQLIDPRLPFQVRQRELQRTFRSLTDGILVVIDADSPAGAREAADALADRLRKRSDLFADVDVAGGGPFFARNALLYLSSEQLEDLADRLSRAQPFLAAVAREQSLVALGDLVAEALASHRAGERTGVDLAAALDRVAAVIEATADGRRAPDPWGSALFGGAAGEEARQRVLALRPVHDSGTLEGEAPEIAAVREAARSLGLHPEVGVRVRITGEPVMNHEELEAVARQSRRVAAVAVVLFAATVTLALRSLRIVLALVASLVVSLVWSNGVAAATVGDLNTISAAFNVLIVGLGGEFGIHFCMRYVEVLGGERPRRDALVETAGATATALVSSAVTTSIGFWIFLLTEFTGVAQLGLISGIGMFLALASTYTVLPALLAFGRPAATVRPLHTPAWLGRLDRLPIRYARAVRRTAVVGGLGALALLPGVRFDYNLVRLHDRTTESVATFEELLSQPGRTPWTADIIAPDLPAAVALAERLRALPTVAAARTLLDWVPDHQEEKGEILATAALFVPERIERGPPRSDTDREAALRRMRDAAGRATGDGVLGRAAARLTQALDRVLERAPLPSELLATLERRLVGSLPVQIVDLQRLVRPDRVTLEALPSEIRGQMLAPDGRARVTVSPAGDMGDSRALERFVASVRAVAPEAGGLGVYVVDWGRVAWRAMLGALGGGVTCMLVFLVVLWRSVRDPLLAFFPLGLAALLTCAVLVLLDRPFNFANVIVLPMLVGMSIDSGIHLVHRHRTEPEEADVLATSTARAVFYAALTTMLAFGSLALAPHGGIAAIGELLAIGVGLVLLCYVVVLPAVLEWDDRHRPRTGRS